MRSRLRATSRPAIWLAVTMLAFMVATVAFPTPAAGQAADSGEGPTGQAAAAAHTCEPEAIHFERPELWSYPGHNLSSVAVFEPTCVAPDTAKNWYDIVLVSTDDAHQPGFQTNQTNEVWFLRAMDADGNVIYESPLSDDIPDHIVTQATYVDTADLTDAAYLQAVHGGDTTNANSVTAIALIIPAERPAQGQPTSTTTLPITPTTAAPATAAPTTAAPATAAPTTLPTGDKPTSSTGGSTAPRRPATTRSTSTTFNTSTTLPRTTTSSTTASAPSTTARPTTTTTLEVASTLNFPRQTIALPPATFLPRPRLEIEETTTTTTCVEPGAAIADELSDSPINSQVWRLYRSLLGRDPQLDGLNYWASLRTLGATHFLVGKYLYFSPEAVDKLHLPDMDNLTFVQHLFANMSCRTPDPSGINYWTSLLDSGSSRWSVAVWFSESPEVLRRTGTFYSYIQ